MRRLVLKLYVTGKDPNAEEVLGRLQDFCKEDTREVEVDVIDVLESPSVAEENRIIATPTLVREFPPPVRKVIGDFSDLNQVAGFLGLKANDKPAKRD